MNLRSEAKECLVDSPAPFSNPLQILLNGPGLLLVQGDQEKDQNLRAARRGDWTARLPQSAENDPYRLVILVRVADSARKPSVERESLRHLDAACDVQLGGGLPRQIDREIALAHGVLIPRSGIHECPQGRIAAKSKFPEKPAGLVDVRLSPGEPVMENDPLF